MITIDTDKALRACGTGATKWLVHIAAGIIGLVAGSTHTRNALTHSGCYAVGIYGTAHTGQATGALDAVGLSSTAARVVSWITGGADIAHALISATVPIRPAAQTFTAICGTKRRVAITAVMSIGITDQADIGDALTATTVSVGLAAHASTAIGHAEWRLAAAARIIGWVAGKAGVSDTLLGTAIAIDLTGHTGPGVSIGNTERRVDATAGIAVSGITGKAVSGHALAGRRIITIIIHLAADALIAIGPHHTIGCGRIATPIGLQLTGLALSLRTEVLYRVIALEVRRAIPADIAIGRFHAEGQIPFAAHIGKQGACPATAVGANALAGL